MGWNKISSLPKKTADTVPYVHGQKIYLFCGSIESKVYKYDVNSDIWSDIDTSRYHDSCQTGLRAVGLK